jgi:hypothetical protein
MSVYSDPEQLQRICDILSRYLRLPFSTEAIPGAIMERVLAHVRGGQRMNTYDFVDVVHSAGKVGWQVKSTKAGTPVTWKRAKIPDAESLIDRSRESARGSQELGDAIIEFCNKHARESIETYGLNEIGYARLIAHDNGEIVYFERSLVTKAKPQLFDPRAFSWKWSTPKITKKKEQLPALHGTHIASGTKWWAAHLLGENQLHFSGERNWWPAANARHRVDFMAPEDAAKFSVEAFLAPLEASDGS